MERMAYKGFESTPKHDEEEGVFYGLVDDVDGLCEYESETAEGVEKAFRDAVDDYIDAYRESFGLSAMIDMERCYGRREAAARESGNDATDAAEIRFLVDAETLGWLERESVRTGISLEKIASAMLRKACNETPALGAPGATVSAGRAETAEVRCDARRRSAMKDTCPYCEAGMIETDEAFSLDGPNGPITITGVHHNKCPECGEITFGPKHLDEMHEFKSSHRSMFP